MRTLGDSELTFRCPEGLLAASSMFRFGLWLAVFRGIYGLLVGRWGRGTRPGFERHQVHLWLRISSSSDKFSDLWQCQGNPLLGVAPGDR